MRTVHSNSIMTTTDSKKREKSFELFLGMVSSCKDSPVMDDLTAMLKSKIEKGK